MRLSLLFSLALAGPALAEVPVVVTDIPPVHSLVAQVMGGLGEPVLLLDQGANAHDYQMRPSEAAALNDAGILFWVGPELTPWLERVVDGGLSGTSVALIDAEGTHRRAFTGSQEEGHDDGHDHGDTDPHAWLDPDNAALWLTVIAASLSEADPANAGTYAANAAAAQEALAKTAADAQALLAPHAAETFVVFHDAYGYFFEHFGLNAPLSLAEGDAASPGAARLSAIRDSLAGAACVFPEAQHDPKPIATLAEGTGVSIGPALDPEGRDIPPGPALYGTLLLGLAEGIASCTAPQ